MALQIEADPEVGVLCRILNIVARTEHAAPSLTVETDTSAMHVRLDLVGWQGRRSELLADRLSNLVGVRAVSSLQGDREGP